MSRSFEAAHVRLSAVPRYQPGRTAASGSAAGKLSSNEAPLGPAPRVIRAIVAASHSVNRYPDEDSVAAMLAEVAGVTPDQVIITNGSDELCYLIASVFLGPGSSAVVGEPCYQIDATATLAAGAHLVRIPLVNGEHDLDAMAAAAGGASVVWLPSPHNPTGLMSRPEELGIFLNAVSESCVVVLDEAYRAFADQELTPNIMKLLLRHPNLIVQRTMSKDRALAGLRIGFGMAAPEIIGLLAKVRAPFSVNSLALAAVPAAIESEAWRTMSIARIREERDLLERTLGSAGITYFPSQTNFVTAQIDHARLRSVLAETKLAVRPGENLGLPGWVRISVGWAPTMALVRDALSRMSAKEGD